MHRALEEARSLPPLEDCSDDEVAMPALAAANEATHPTTPKPLDLHDWTPITVSKVLDRLTPTVPIIDSYSCDFYDVGKGAGAAYRRALTC